MPARGHRSTRAWQVPCRLRSRRSKGRPSDKTPLVTGSSSHAIHAMPFELLDALVVDDPRRVTAIGVLRCRFDDGWSSLGLGRLGLGRHRRHRLRSRQGWLGRFRGGDRRRRRLHCGDGRGGRDGCSRRHRCARGAGRRHAHHVGLFVGTAAQAQRDERRHQEERHRARDCDQHDLELPVVCGEQRSLCGGVPGSGGHLGNLRAWLRAQS